MIEATIQQALLAQLAQLPTEKQQRVLEFARTLADAVPRGTSGDRLLAIAGTMTAEEAQAMLSAIE